MAALLIVAACAALNRLAGGGMWIGQFWDRSAIGKLPGRALYPATLGIGLIAWASLPWPAAAAVALAFAIWRSPAWGHLIGLGRHAPDRPTSDLESALLGVADGNVGLALMLRHLVFGFLGMAIIALWAESALMAVAPIPFAILATAAYEMGWRLHERGLARNPILPAELAVGAIWGLIIVALATL